MAKLTKAQMALLRDSDPSTHCVKAYAPARRLVKLGYAEWKRDDQYSGNLHITPAGRAALEQQNDGGRG